MKVSKPNNQSSVFIPTRSTIRDREDEKNKTPQQSSISGFGADMDTGRLTRYAGDAQGNLLSKDIMPSSEQVFQQFGNLIQKGNQRRQKEAVEAQRRKSLSDAALGSALVYTKQNKGFMPTDITEALSAQLGMPIVGGNFTQNGDFVIYGRKQLQSPNGMVSGERIEPIAVASPEMQYGLLKRTGLGQSIQQEIYDNLSTRFTEQQLKDRGITNPSALSQKDALALADAQMKERRGEFDMRISQINNLMAQRKVLVDEGAPGSEEAIATIDKKIAILNEMNSAATKVNEVARALGVTGVGIGGGKPITKEGYEIASEFEIEGGRILDGFTEVVSNGKKVRQVQYLPESGEYLVNTEEVQPDGSYSFRVSKGKQHLGSEYVTFVGEDGRVRQRKRMDGEGATEQHDDGLFVNVQRNDGQFVRIFVPAGKVIKTPFGNKRVSREEGGGYQLRDTYKQPNWSAREGILAEWEKSNPAKTEERKELSRKQLIELGSQIYRKETNAETATPPMGIEIEPNEEVLIAKARKELNKRRSRANWGKRRRGGTDAVQKGNQMLDEVVAAAAGISVDEAKKIREEKENRKEKERKEKENRKFDTKLTPEEEIQYQQWRRTLPKPLQYEGDYDLRGYWKDPETKKEAVEGDHFIDKYKKPNHPTFSNESQYAVGENAEKAGHWSDGVYIPPKK